MTRSWKRSAGMRRGAVGALALVACALLAVVATASTARTRRDRSTRRQGAGGRQARGTASSGANAYGIATARSGDVYVADTDNRRVQVFSAKGAFKRSYPFAADEVPQDVATDPGGSAWAAILQAAEARQLGGPGQTLATGRRRSASPSTPTGTSGSRPAATTSTRSRASTRRAATRLDRRSAASRRRATSRRRPTGRSTSSTG